MTDPHNTPRETNAPDSPRELTAGQLESIIGGKSDAPDDDDDDTFRRAAVFGLPLMLG
jgi:hypothetical protein